MRCHSPPLFVGNMFQDSQVDALNPGIVSNPVFLSHTMFLHVYTYIHTFPLNGNTYGSSLVYLHCQHHYFALWGQS